MNSINIYKEKFLKLRLTSEELKELENYNFDSDEMDSVLYEKDLESEFYIWYENAPDEHKETQPLWNFDNLNKMQLGRVRQQMDKQWHFPQGVMSMENFINAVQPIAKTVDGKSYEIVWSDNGQETFSNVPKVLFDCLQLPVVE